ncbi:MAG: carboxypeptidase-like regulatory domain-containing protein, partial [Myxococcota bacterium]
MSRGPHARAPRFAAPAALALGLLCVVGAAPRVWSVDFSSSRLLTGAVREDDGAPVPGAMVTFQRGDPAHAITVFTNADGRYRIPFRGAAEPATLRVRRIGWKDLHLSSLPESGAGQAVLQVDLRVERERDPAALAAQLPANYWYRLLLDKIEDPDQQEEFKRQCTFCHQQGNPRTRVVRDEEDWRKLIALMGRMGGMISRDLRERLPALLNAAYDPAQAVPALTRDMYRSKIASPPPIEVRRALIEEWELGGRASMLHDMVVHPDGRIYSVDMSQDKLYRLDPGILGGRREVWDIPQGDLPLGGVFASVDRSGTPNS